MESPMKMEKPKKKRSALTIILIVLGVLLALFLLFAIVGMSGEDEETFSENEQPWSEADQDETAVPDADGEASDERWTLMLYLCGTDLESEEGCCTENLMECLDTLLPEYVNLLVCTGGTRMWQVDFVDPDRIQYHRIYDYGEVETLQTLPLASMGAPETLGDFLNYGVRNYPADRYAAILWNHGGGMKGVAYDELFEFDSLTLSELDTAFSMAGATFELIGFDACLMATLENAVTLSPYGRYMVASEEVEPGEGWDYSALLNDIIENPTASGADVGKTICDTYYEKCGAWADSCTLSVTDLTMVRPLAEAFDALAGEMTLDTQDVDKFRALTQSIARAENYGGNTDSEGYFNLVDIGDMVLNAKSVLSETGEAVLDALFDAVVYNVNGSARANANGLATFYPIKADNAELTSYAQTAAFSKNYLSYLSASRKGWKVPASFTGMDFPTPPADIPQTTVADADYTIDAETRLSDAGSFILDVNSGVEYVASVYFTLYRMDYERNRYLYLGRDDDLNVSDDLLQYSDNFRGVWPALNGIFVNLNLLSATEAYNLYSIPVMINGAVMNLRARYNWDSGAYEVLGAIAPESGSGASARQEYMPKEGDVIAILMRGADWESGRESFYKVGEFTLKGTLRLAEQALTDGDYLYQYELTDVLGDTYYSDEIIMECKDGEITLYETEEVAE